MTHSKSPSRQGRLSAVVMDVGNGWSEGTSTTTGRRVVFPTAYLETFASPPPPSVPTRPPPPPSPTTTTMPPAAAGADAAATTVAATPLPPAQSKPRLPSRAAQSVETKSGELANRGAPGDSSNAGIVAEIEVSVRDWRGKLTLALSEQQYGEFAMMKNQIATLLEWRRLLLDPKYKHQEWVRQQVIKLIELRRQVDERFTVPRTSNDGIATTENSTISELHEKHKEMEQRMVGGSNFPAKARDFNIILLDLKSPESRYRVLVLLGEVVQ